MTLSRHKKDLIACALFALLIGRASALTWRRAAQVGRQGPEALASRRDVLLSNILTGVLVAAAPRAAVAENLENMRRYAETMMAAGQFDLAEKALGDLLEQGNEKDVVVLSDRGNCRSAQGKFKEALEDFDAALAINANVPDAILGRGIAKEQLKDFNGAIADYEKVNALVKKRTGKDDEAAVANRGNALAGLGRYEEARQEMRRALKIGKKGETIMPQVADALFSYELGDDLYSAQQLKALVNKYPGFTDSRAALAAIQFAEGDSARAQENLEIVFEEDLRYSDPEWVTEIRRWPPRVSISLRKLVLSEEGAKLLREALDLAGKKASWED